MQVTLGAAEYQVLSWERKLVNWGVASALYIYHSVMIHLASVAEVSGLLVNLRVSVDIGVGGRTRKSHIWRRVHVRWDTRFVRNGCCFTVRGERHDKQLPSFCKFLGHFDVPCGRRVPLTLMPITCLILVLCYIAIVSDINGSFCRMAYQSCSLVIF